MPYLYNTEEDRRAMLASIGADSIADLFADIPEKFRLGRPLDLPPALCELELTDHLQRLAAANLAGDRAVCFLGGGSYDHFIPAVVDALAGRSEFYTSYTPYQAEVSQGNLQAMFEYQTLVCQLTGMDVSNASLYDGATAATEAVLMCLHALRRKKVVTTAGVHPEYREVLQTYLAASDVELVVLSADGLVVDPDRLAAAVDENTACVLLQTPNFFGSLEDGARAAQIAHDAGAALIAAVDPIGLGLLQRPGDWGADVVVAEGQTLGNPMSYGGPNLGMLACREHFLRRMPGRIAGQTVDHRDRRCWVLTLQTREQHIRREKATSNICTNQGLLALRAAIYLSTLGPCGLAETAQLCLQKAHYAARRLCQSPRYELAGSAPFFKEFVVRDKQNDVQNTLARAAEQGILAGVPLGRWYPDLQDCLLIAVTEKRTREQIDRMVEVLGA